MLTFRNHTGDRARLTAHPLRLTLGLVMLGALVFASGASASPPNTTEVTGALTGGLGVVAPGHIEFGSLPLTGNAMTSSTTVGAWSFENYGGTNGFVVQVNDTGIKPASGGSTLAGFQEVMNSPEALTPTSEASEEEAVKHTQPQLWEGAASSVIGTSPETVYFQEGTLGHGSWQVPASENNSIAMHIPANAPAGAYEDTLVFTAAEKVG